MVARRAPVTLATWILAFVLGGAAVAQASPQPAPAVDLSPTPDHITLLPADPPPTAPPEDPAPAPIAEPPPVPVPQPRLVHRPVAVPPPLPPPPPAPSRIERIESAAQVVPAVWRDAIGHWFAIRDGRTSLARGDGRITIGTSHVDGGDGHLRTVVAHEFGHLIAYEYGTWAYDGAAPAGWPYIGPRPEEMWGDCVAEVFTGRHDPAHGLPGCPAAARAWTARWLQAGPDGHPRTR